MDRIKSGSTLLIGGALCATFAFATTVNGQGDEAEHTALRELKSIYEKAVNETQLDLLAPHLHANFSGVMVTNDPVASQKDIEEYWQWVSGLLGDGGTYRVTLNPERSTLLGNFALARGTADEVASIRGKELKFQSNWTALLEKVDGAWKILRVHGSMNPVANPFAKASAKAASYTSGAIGGGIGFVVGLLVMLVTRRKKS